MGDLCVLARSGLERALDLVLPRVCVNCARPISCRLGTLPLCPPCRGRLEPVAAEHACRGCLRPLPGGLAPRPRCLACLADPPPYREARALWRYRPPADALLRALKYRRLEFLGPPLARAALVLVPPAERGAFDLVAAVPLDPLRRWRRGFNQAEAIARPLAAGLGLPFGRPLRRRLGGGRQAGAGRLRRRANPVGAFAARGSATALRGRRVLLVDDILTTGSTARSAATALLAAGALEVSVLVIAATPPSDPQGSA